MLREEQHAQAWQDRMDVLKGRTIPPRVGAMGLEVSSSQSITSLAAGAARCGTMGHSGTGSRRVKQLGESQEQRVLRASWRSKSCSEEDGSSKDGYGELSYLSKPVCSSSPGWQCSTRVRAVLECGQHMHSSTVVPWDQHCVLWQAHGVLTESKQLPCSGLREANQVEQRPRRGLLSRVLYRTTATRIWMRSG